MNMIPIKRALLSVSDKTGLLEFAQSLVKMGVEIISTGGTSKLLADAGIPYRKIDEFTGLPEMLEGRVKTLHPKLHGGILGKRDIHQEEALKHGIEWIDLVVVNFYPFSQAIQNKPDMSFAEAVEFIDIGGPTMVRAAAKNFAWVGVVTDPNDYPAIIEMLKKEGGITQQMRQTLAQKVFALTSNYDAAIHQYFAEKNFSAAKQMDAYPHQINMTLEKKIELRYGENPHQSASAYQVKGAEPGILSAKQHQGKELSFNNILDSEAALATILEFSLPTCVIIKHANPCGVASATNIDDAFDFAYHADSVSAFGGIMALNRPCTKKIAETIASFFMEVVIAPSYTPEALEVLASKTNLRLLELPIENRANHHEMKFISGGVLIQEKDKQFLTANDLQIVTRTLPSQEEMDEMLFAWRVVKHIKSNGILLTKKMKTIGIGAGQVSRIDAVDLAVRKAGEQISDSILASDAFFPFRDSIDRIANSGVKAIIQPGGSMRDQEVIAACNEHQIAMVFTGKRCFKH